MGNASLKSKHSTEVYLEEEIRLVLLGKTGSGKSATGNSILGSKMFESKLSGESITRVCKQNNAARFKTRIVVVDTPGIFDTKESNEEIQNEICKCIGLTSPGPHAFILVLNVATRYTEEDIRTVQHFERYFGQDLYKYLFVLFTRKDQLDQNGINLEDFIENSPKELKNLIEKCDKRVFAIDNTCRDKDQDKQVKKLLSLISENIARNQSNYYTSEAYEKVEELIKREEEERKKKIIEEFDRKKKDLENKIRKEEERERIVLEEKFKREKEQRRKLEEDMKEKEQKRKLEEAMKEEEQRRQLKEAMKEKEQRRKLKEAKKEKEQRRKLEEEKELKRKLEEEIKQRRKLEEEKELKRKFEEKEQRRMFEEEKEQRRKFEEQRRKLEEVYEKMKREKEEALENIREEIRNDIEKSGFEKFMIFVRQAIINILNFFFKPIFDLLQN